MKNKTMTDKECNAEDLQFLYNYCYAGGCGLWDGDMIDCRDMAERIELIASKLAIDLNTEEADNFAEYQRDKGDEAARAEIGGER